MKLNRESPQARAMKMVPYFFILPAFILHICLVTGPSLSTLVMSLFEWNGLGGARFIGFGNFVEIFTRDLVVRTAVTNNVKWLLIFITIPIILGLAVAIMVSQIKSFQILFRTVFFVPYVLSAAVVGKIFTAYYNPYYGINVVFKALGWTKLANTLWIGNPDIALYSVAFVDNWHWWGFVMVMFLAALQQIDPSLYESAKMDGANRLQEVLYISIPGIKQTIAFMLIMTVMWSFLTFDYVYVMTYGGPANATEILATWIYKNAFVKYAAGYANALCVLQSGICLVFYFLQKYISKKGGLNEE
jgi:raffinose/stachyose/melibiose transport system permease protein